MREWPNNIVADRHEISGKWVLQYLTDEQVRKCHIALMAKDIGAKIPARSAEVLSVQKMLVGEDFLVETQTEAHRLRIYISRVFGRGAGCMRAANGGYRVWRIK